MQDTRKLIGKVAAIEKAPTTMDKFTFWTDPKLQLHAFDIVKVEHVDGSYTFGAIDQISHITDAQSFLTGYISSDFGDPRAKAPTLRISMNYAEASVSFNTKNIYTPVLNDSPVYLASAEEITQALGLDKIRNPIVCGSLTMYGGTLDEITLPVKLNAAFMLGPEGAHMNISGISGLAAKTSYAMFLMKAVQERYIHMHDEDESIAFVIFNVKGCDLMAIDEPNAALGEAERKRYESLGLSADPFRNVKYYIPYYQTRPSTYLPADEVDEYISDGRMLKFKYCYDADRESLEMLFSGIDDPTQSMEAIISRIVDENDKVFAGIKTWDNFRETVREFATSSKFSGRVPGDITVQSWRKFSRIINKTLNNDEMFVNRSIPDKHECRLADEMKTIKANEVRVIDIAKLPEDKQAFVFGDVLKAIYSLKLGEYDSESNVAPPSRIVIFIDELNKYASKDTPKNSPVLREILDVTERGRSLGVIMFGAEQFRSAIHNRVTGNCAVHAYGRTNVLEASGKDYTHFPAVYRGILTRLEQGEYVLQSPVFRTFLRVDFPRPVYRQFND